jgi:hypothetical protein
MPAIQQQRTNIKNAVAGARKIIGKFNPLVLGEVHTAGNNPWPNQRFAVRHLR